MSTFERYLALWVGLCIAVGVALGHLPPAVFQAIGSAEVAQVNLPVAVLIWLMMGRWLPWRAQEPIGPDALAQLAPSSLEPAIV